MGSPDDHDHPLYIGQDFWYRMTGDADFYQELINAIAEVATEAKGSKIIKGVADKLAKTDAVIKLSGRLKI